MNQGMDCFRPAETALIYESELDYVSRCVLDYPNIETGGQLFGYWTAFGVPVVLFAIGPGPGANHSYAFFNQDVNYLLKVGELLVSRHGLQHIGEWHSHHRLGLAVPSSHDVSTMVNCIRRQNLGRFLLAIGNCTATCSTFNAFNFSESSGYDYSHAAWDVKDGESPFRAAIAADRELSEMLIPPQTARASHGMLLKVGAGVSFRVPPYAAGYWLKDKENNRILKDIVDFLADRSANGQCRVQMDAARCACLSFHAGGDVRVSFPQGFPFVAPVVTLNERVLERRDAVWQVRGDILADFKEYYKNLLGEKDDDKFKVSGGTAGVNSVLGGEPVQVSGDGNAECSCSDGGENQSQEHIHVVCGTAELPERNSEGVCN